MTGIPKIPFLGGSLWKAGAMGAMVLVVIISGFLLKVQYDSRQINKERLVLVDKIENPITGYIAKLRTSENNVLVLKSAVVRSNNAYRAQSKAASAELVRLNAALRLAQIESADLKRRVDAILRRPIKGTTELERAQDVDKMILEDLKK